MCNRKQVNYFSGIISVELQDSQVDLSTLHISDVLLVGVLNFSFVRSPAAVSATTAFLSWLPCWPPGAAWSQPGPIRESVGCYSTTQRLNHLECLYFPAKAPALVAASLEVLVAFSWWGAFYHLLLCPWVSFSEAPARPAPFWSSPWELSGGDAAKSSDVGVWPPRPSCTDAPCPWWTERNCPAHQKRWCAHLGSTGEKKEW